MAEHALQMVRSNPVTQFTTAIAAQGWECEILPMTADVSSTGTITGVSIWSTDDLDWVVWIFSKGAGDVFHPYTLADEQTDADIYSASTIGKNTWAVADDQYNGDEVEIIGGTGDGQSRTILDTESNSGNGRLTVATWDTTPDATSDFRVNTWGRLIAQLSPTATNPTKFAGDDALYRFEATGLQVPYIDDLGLNQIYVALFNDEASTAKTVYSSGGRAQVTIAFRPHR